MNGKPVCDDEYLQFSPSWLRLSQDRFLWEEGRLRDEGKGERREGSEVRRASLGQEG